MMSAGLKDVIPVQRRRVAPNHVPQTVQASKMGELALLYGFGLSLLLELAGLLAHICPVALLAFTFIFFFPPYTSAH